MQRKTHACCSTAGTRPRTHVAMSVSPTKGGAPVSIAYSDTPSALRWQPHTRTEHGDAMQDQSQHPGRIAARCARTTRRLRRPRRRRRRCTPARCKQACRAFVRRTKTRLRPRPRRRGCRRFRGPPRWTTARRAWAARLACPSPQQQPPHYPLPASNTTPHRNKHIRQLLIVTPTQRIETKQAQTRA
jgi:hypothetical protein